MNSETRIFNGIKIYMEHANLSKNISVSTDNSLPKIPFIIQHGHSANHFFVRHVVEYFAQKGWPVLTFDWRGHGWSQKNLSGKYKLDILVEDLHHVFHDFLEKEYGYKQCYLLGHSMGGFLAMKYTLKYPEDIKKLVLLATSACIAFTPIVKLGMKFLTGRYKADYEKWFGKKKPLHEELGIEFFPQWSDPTLMPDPQAVIELQEDMYTYDIRSLIPSISCPVAVWVGDKDNLKGSSKLIAKLIPGAQFELLKGITHNLTIHARDVLPQKIEAFLQK